MNTGRRQRGTHVVSALFLLPALILLAAISLYPLVRTLWLSFTDAQLGFLTSRGVGLRNFSQLWHSALFWTVWEHTLLFTAISTAIECVIGMAMALVLSETFRGRGILRASMLVPWAIPAVVSSVIFQYLFDAQHGPVNYLLRETHVISEYVNFLGSTRTALATLIAVDAWRSTPFMALLILAALQNVPDSLWEAAKIDGATAWQTFWLVRLPIVAPALLIAALLRTLDAFRMFDLPHVLTGGGPANATETLSSFAYKQLFFATNLGYGSAVSTVMLATEVVIAAGFILALSRRFKVVEG